MTLGEISTVVGLAATIVGGGWALIKVAARQFARELQLRFEAADKARQAFQTTLTERFDAQERMREEGRRAFEQRFTKIEDGHVRIERDLLAFKLEVAETRVAREDFVRNQTLIEAKLDGMATKMENWFLRMRNKES